jgi:hypothetical protein
VNPISLPGILTHAKKMIGHANLTMRTTHMITTIIALVHPLLHMHTIDPLPALDLLLALVLLPVLATVPLLVIALDPLLMLILLHVLVTIPVTILTGRTPDSAVMTTRAGKYH